MSLTLPPLSLPRLCTTHLVLTLFSLPDIKCHLKWLLLTQNRRDYEKKSSSLLQRLQKKLRLLHLPLPVQTTLLFTLHSMAQKLLLYLKPIAWSLQKCSTPATAQLSPADLELHIESFITHLHWTQNGTINAARTFETLHNLKKLPQTPAMYTVLFNLCLENAINNVWNLSPAPKGLKQFVTSLNDDLSIHKSEIIPAYFVYKYYNKMDELLLIVHRLLDNKVYHKGRSWSRCCRHVSIEENMFRFAVFNGNFAGVKYFWEKLSSDERARTLPRMLEAGLMAAGSRNGWITPLRLQEYEEHSEIAVYLMGQVGSLEKMFSPLEKRRDFLMALGAFVDFPYQETFIWSVETNFHLLDVDSFNFITAGTLYKAWKHHETFGVGVLENKYFGFFRRIWERSSLEVRKSYGVNYWRIFFLLGKLKELEVVREIYREEGLRGRMRGALDEGERWFRVFYKRDSMGFWWWFEEEVLSSEGERRRFRGMICEVLMLKEKDELWQEYKERAEGKGRKREIKFKK